VSIKRMIQVVWLIFCLFAPTCVFGDNIHFDTASTEQLEQWWYGKVLRISDNHVHVRFRHKGHVAIHRIHVSRILSIYFDDSVEHAYPILLSKKVEEPIPSNLLKLRRLYLFTNYLGDDFPQLKIYGPVGNRSIRGNIIEFNLAQKMMKIRARFKSGKEEFIEDSELIKHIRAWVR
jgi:hypothetical protein